MVQPELVDVLFSSAQNLLCPLPPFSLAAAAALAFLYQKNLGGLPRESVHDQIKLQKLKIQTCQILGFYVKL